MFVVVQHRVSDPAAFQTLGAQALAELPAGLRVHQSLPGVGSTSCVCVWEAESVEAVRDFLEARLGGASVNEYFAVDAAAAIGLPPATFTMEQVVRPRGPRSPQPADRRAPLDVVVVEIPDAPPPGRVDAPLPQPE